MGFILAKSVVVVLQTKLQEKRNTRNKHYDYPSMQPDSFTRQEILKQAGSVEKSVGSDLFKRLK